MLQIQSNSVDQDGSSNQKSYLPWILGGVGVVGLIGVIVWLLMRNKKKD